MPDGEPGLFDRVEGWRKDFRKLRAKVGTGVAIAVLLAIGTGCVWWFWEDLKGKPGVAELVALFERHAITPARAGHLTVAVVHLEDDPGAAHEKFLRDELDNNFDGAETKPIDRTIIIENAATDQAAIASATEEARGLLKQSRADVLLWGKVISLNTKCEMRLYWTTAGTLPGVKATAAYQDPGETIALPPLFWDDLKQVLGVLVQSRIASMSAQLAGHYSADKLVPLIEQVRGLLRAKRGVWTDETITGVRAAFADALESYGDQAGDNDVLKESIAVYQQVLAVRDRVPLDWATTQNRLGNALWTLGARESGTARLQEAVAAYRAALEERTRDRVPLDWAGTQNNLGNALVTLGERESGTARLQEAVAAYRAALEERTRDRVPLDWAATQNNLGAALRTLGERESGTARLQEAVAAYRAALEERTRDRVPLDWAMTQNNLGTALKTLGQRESGAASLEEAVAAYHAALEERTRDRVPLGWATTQNNLGNALRTLGERESGTARLQEAVAAYHAALEERTRDRVPLDWAMTQNNLGNALWTLGERESDTARLEEAVAAYRAALEERTRDRVPLDWAQTQNNLGIALATLGERESGTARLEEAVAAWDQCLAVVKTNWPAEWVQQVQAKRDQAAGEIARRKEAAGQPSSGLVTPASSHPPDR